MRSLDASLGIDLQREIVLVCLLMPLAPSELASVEESTQTVLRASTEMQAETLRIAFRYRGGTISPVVATEGAQPAAATPLERREQLIFKALAARKAGDQQSSQLWSEYKAIAPPNQTVTDDWLEQLALEVLEREWAR